MAPGGAATVVAIVDDDKLRLDDGELVRLISLQAPKVPLRLINFKIWLLINEPKDAFARLALGKRLHLGLGSRNRDRHGRVLAHLHAEDSTLIAEMLHLGWAWVYTFYDNRRIADEMMWLEQAARRPRRGVWWYAFYRLRSAEYLWGDINAFQIVESRVRAVATVKWRTHLNSGDNWSRDFAIVVAAKHRRQFSARHLTAPDSRLIRVLGG